MNQEDKATFAAIGAGAVIAVGMTLNFVHIVRIEKKKRAKIEEWKLENLACIQNSHDRLMNMIESDDYNTDDFFTAVAEESQFLKMVRDQPKY